MSDETKVATYREAFSRNAKFIGGCIAVSVFVSGAAHWLYRLDSQKVERVPIGKVVRLVPGSSWNWPNLLETETGFYPLGDLLAVEKGAPVVLETRRSGARHVCDEAGRVCATTARRQVVAARSEGKP